MRYARIVDVHIPMTKTDLVFKATEAEVPLLKLRWNDSPNRRKDVPISITPMPLDGADDPFRPVGDADAEMRRIKKLWTSNVFERVYTISQWEEVFEKKTVPSNAWSEARARRDAQAAAEKQALAASETAKLVHDAVQMRAKADAEVAAKALAKESAALDQSDKDRETLAGVGAKDDEDELQSVGTGRATTPTKGRKA